MIMKNSLTFFGSFIVFFLCFSVSLKAQTALPLIYSPDSWVNSTITKGDTLIVGGRFKNVGKYTGGGALFYSTSDQPDLNFPKFNGNVWASTPDGSGGFYVYGDFYRESELPQARNFRIEHILANNTFDANFSLPVTGNGITYLFFYKGILYIGCWLGIAPTVNGQQLAKLSGLNVSTKTLVTWLPSIIEANSQIDRIFASGSTLYFIGKFNEVGGVVRQDIASIEIGTGVIRPWYPGNNWVNYYYYGDLVFYKDKVIIGGKFNDNNLPGDFACAMVDTLNGQSFTYMFQTDCTTYPATCLFHGASVERLAIKNDMLFTFSSGTFDTRVTALNLNAFVSSVDNGTIWKKYFNMIARPSDMVIIDNSLFLMGQNFEEVYLTNHLNTSPENIERKIKNGAKLNIHTGALENWFPDLTGYISDEVKTMSVIENKIFAGGWFSHARGIERKGIYMMNAITEEILPFDLDFSSIEVQSLKLVGDTLYVGGSLNPVPNENYSVLAFNVKTGSRLEWGIPNFNYTFSDMEVSKEFVFIGGSLVENPNGTGRKNLFAFDRKTGQLQSWAPNPDLPVKAFHIANNQIYVGGDFTNISGQSRNKGASYNLADLSLTSWNPNANGSVNSIFAKNGVVWIGGQFSQVGGINNKLIAPVDPINGVLAFNTNSDLAYYQVNGMISKGCKLFAGGDFTLNYPTNTCNTLAINNLASNTFVPNNDFCLNLSYATDARIFSLSMVGDDLFFGGMFSKINSNTKNPYLGRIRFPSNYFTPCEIGNCGNALSLISTADDYNTGTYIQKTNMEISATNKITGNSQVTFKSGKSITLQPNTANSSGFLVRPAAGGSFKAEIEPCN